MTMIIYNPDIEDTEAAVISTKAGKVCCIIKLAGGIGDISLWFEDIQGTGRKLGLNISVITSGVNMIDVNSFDNASPLHRNDRFIIYFHGGGTWSEAFPIGGIKTGGMRKNFLSLSNMHASMMLEKDIIKIEVHNVKTGTVQAYRFKSWGSDQYKNPEEGAKLFRIMLKRLMAAKIMMAEGIVR